MTVIVTPIGFGEAASGSVCNALAVPLTAGRPVVAWVTSVNVGFTVAGITADLTGTPQYFGEFTSNVVDGVSGDVTGALWYLDAPVSGTFDIQVATNNISARRMVQLFEVTGHENTALDSWRAGFSTSGGNILSSAHTLAIATSTGDTAVMFLALRQNGSAPNLTRNTASALVENRLSGTTLRGIVVTGSDAASAVLGGTTATDTQSVLLGLAVRPYGGTLLLATTAVYTLTGLSAGLVFGAASSYSMLADAATFTVSGQGATFTKIAAGALDPITLGPFASSVQRLYVRATAIEINSVAPLVPTSGWTTFSEARSQDDANAVIVRGEFKISTALSETSQPLIAAYGDSISVMTALVSSPSYVLTAATASLALTGLAVALTIPRTMGAAAGSFALAGPAVGLTAQHTVSVSAATFTLSVIDAALLSGRVLAADTATYAWSTVAAGITAQRLLTADTASIVWTGFDAALTGIGAFALLANPGSFTLAGSDVVFRAIAALVAETGAFTLSGAATGFVAQRVLTADTASVVWTGLDAALTATSVYAFTADAGAFSATGADASLVADRWLAAEVAPFAIAGEGIGLLAGRLLTADPASYAVAGDAVGLLITRRLVADVRAYTRTGRAITLTYSGTYRGQIRFVTARGPATTYYYNVGPALRLTPVEPSS